VFDCFSDLGLCRIRCCMVVHHGEVMFLSLFVMSPALYYVIFVIALCSHACVICVFYCLFRNLPQSALSFETYCNYSICLCGVHTEKISQTKLSHCLLGIKQSLSPHKLTLMFMRLSLIPNTHSLFVHMTTAVEICLVIEKNKIHETRMICGSLADNLPKCTHLSFVCINLKL